MDPAALIPIPDAIPVSWWWFQAFLLLTFFLHLVAMNAMLGTAFIGLVSHLRGTNDRASCTEAISSNLPFTIAFAVNFGVAPLLFVQVLYGHLIYTSSILMAVFWLAVVGLLIIAYGLAYVYKDLYPRRGDARLAVIGLATLLLLAIAFIFTNNISLMQKPIAWDRYFDQPRGLLLALDDPMLLPRYLHFMVSSVAVGGLAIALFFHWRQRGGDRNAGAWVASGCRWFSYATMANFAVGFWFLATLPKGMLTTTIPGLLLLATLVGGIALSVPAIGLGLAGRALPALWCTLGTIGLMVLARSLLRTVLLAPWFSPAQLPVTPSSAPLLFFLLVLLAGVTLIGWMVRFTLRSCANQEDRP